LRLVGLPNQFLLPTWANAAIQQTSKENAMPDLEPPSPLPPAARAVWDRHVKRITEEGRLSCVDLDALAVYAQTFAMFEELQATVNESGVLITGRAGDLVRNAALSPLASARDALLRLSRGVPLFDADAARELAKFERFLDNDSV
jgi:phage terminase small subunit